MIVLLLWAGGVLGCIFEVCVGLALLRSFAPRVHYSLDSQRVTFSSKHLPCHEDSVSHVLRCLKIKTMCSIYRVQRPDSRNYVGD